MCVCYARDPGETRLKYFTLVIIGAELESLAFVVADKDRVWQLIQRLHIRSIDTAANH